MHSPRSSRLETACGKPGRDNPTTEFSMPAPTSNGWTAEELGIEVDDEDVKPMTKYWSRPDYLSSDREAWNPMPPPWMLERALSWLTDVEARRSIPSELARSANAAIRTLPTLPEWPRTQTAERRRAKMACAFVAAAEAFDPDTTGNLLLAGPTGAGKTLAALHAVLQLWQRRLAAYRPLPKVLFVKHTALATARRNSQLGRESQLIEDAIAAELLIIDDIGQAEDRDPALFEVIDARYDAGRLTIATTGLDPHAADKEGFKARIGEHYQRRLLQTKRPGKLVSTFAKPKLQAVAGVR
jgi:DNA replication protein DnaC